MLDHDHVRDVAESGLPNELQVPLRLEPHLVERIVPHHEFCHEMPLAVASIRKLTGLGCAAKGWSDEVEGCRNRLRPESDCSHRIEYLCLAGD